MKMSFFCRTFAGDAEWLNWLILSIQKFCTGYHEFVFAYPDHDRDIILPIIGDAGFKAKAVPNNPSLGYLDQQASKMCADKYCEGDYIGFVDSDCFFVLPNSPEDHFIDGKIKYLITPYSELVGQVPWQHPTEKALGFPCPFETMRRHPEVYPREVIQHCREHVEAIHQKPLRSYILSQPGNQFSEFNVIGSYAREKEPDKFMFLDTRTTPLWPAMLKQSWSRGGISKKWMEKMTYVLSDDYVPGAVQGGHYSV